MKDELLKVVEWLNETYNQDNPEYYDFFHGAKPCVVRYNDHIAVSTWACGAIVCIRDQILFVCEDDGYWFIHEDNSGWWGFQSGFSVAWAESFTNAMAELKKYVYENGTPVYFSGLGDTKVVCHYCLSGENEEKK